MNAELLEAVYALEKERGLDAEVLFQAIEESLVSAYKREFDVKNAENISAEVDRQTGETKVFLEKTVVAEVEHPNEEISLEDALSLSDEFELGDMLLFELDPQDFGRLAAQTAKNVIMQKMQNAEREMIEDEFAGKIGELVTGTVQRRDRNEVIVDIGRAEAVLTRHEQVRTEPYAFNQRMKFYVLKVDERHGRLVVFVSRSHPNLIRKLFEQEVPEIRDGIVEIVSVAREAGSRTKMAVASRDPNVDALGACVGQHGMRVQAVLDELNGERIDIVEWSPELETFISNALSPARVQRVDIDEENRAARVIVPDGQLSQAIGREGQNARLAARLTGWKVDIKSESQYSELIEQEFLRQFEEAASQAAEELDNEDAEAMAADDDYPGMDDPTAEMDEEEDESETDEA